MKKIHTSQSEADEAAETRTKLEQVGEFPVAAGAAQTPEPGSAVSPRPAAASVEEQAEQEREAGENDAALALDGGIAHLGDSPRRQICRMFVEGSGFEEIEAVLAELGWGGISHKAIRSYFRGRQDIQQKRVRRSVKNAESLLAKVDNNANTAEARLARAIFLTGFTLLTRDDTPSTLVAAERSRLGRENQELKNQWLVLRKQKTAQDIDFSRARTRLMALTEGKLQAEILKLQRQAAELGPGEPLGAEMFQRIQEIYGLACNSLCGEEGADEADGPVPQQRVH